MNRSLCTPENREAFAAATQNGVSIPDAARVIGVRVKTVKGWITRGRREESGPYREFADAVDAARQAYRGREEPASEEELKLMVWRSAKAGSVAAQRLYWEMLKADEPDEPVDPFDALDGGER